jgi:hypothetical protein
MFFVADGMTPTNTGFESAVRAFLGALLPDSPFLMAFMEGSSGYDVHGTRFPSVQITPRFLDELLRGSSRHGGPVFSGRTTASERCGLVTTRCCSLPDSPQWSHDEQ